MRSLRSALLLALALTAAAAAAQPGERFVIPLAEDTLFFVDNRGTSRVLITLNGYAFKLAADPVEVARSRNAYLIPRQGQLTFNIAPYMRPGEDANEMTVFTQGPPGSEFQFVLAPEFVEGQSTVAFTLAGLEPIPEDFGLTAWPNPSAEAVQVAFRVPEARILGLPVRLSVLDVLGRTVRVLLDDVRFPGTHPATWDGRDAAGQRAAAGLYLLRLEAGEARQTLPLTRLR